MTSAATPAGPVAGGWRVRLDGTEQPFLLVANDIGGAMELLRRRVGAAALARASVYRVPALL